jgi:hypothetical protein
MSNDIRLLQLSNYVRPKLEENKAKNWVLNGRNNSFYQYVIDRFNGSPTNAAIISSYIDLIYGQGLNCRNKNLSQWINFVTILNKKELRKIIADFELFGEASMQVVRAKNGKDLGAIYHVPKQLVVPALENEEGEIDTYFYSRDWSNITKYPAQSFPAFGTSKENIEIYCIKPYKAGKNYFSDPDYLSALPYAEMEEELANFYINSIKKGLSAGYIINIPDGGTLTPEAKDELETKIKQKLTGSPNAMNFVISFNGRDAEITIIPFPVNDAQHKQWEYLTGESRQQIMTGHKVVSPKLFGIMSEGGFGNNANELDEAEGQLMKRVIAPKQSYIIEALEEILTAYNIGLDLYFIPLSEQSTTTQMSSDEKKKNLDTIVADELIDLGEKIGDEWELIESKVIETEADLHFATSTGTALPNARSTELDGELFKSRLRYTGLIKDNSREFCKKMISANKLYRVEDIQRMSKMVVNEGFGPEGTNTYDILLYKGGARCHHTWTRETYALKADVNNPNAKKVTPAQARNFGEILPNLANKYGSKIYQKPNDMPNNGFLKPQK